MARALVDHDGDGHDIVGGVVAMVVSVGAAAPVSLSEAIRCGVGVRGSMGGGCWYMQGGVVFARDWVVGFVFCFLFSLCFPRRIVSFSIFSAREGRRGLSLLMYFW